MTRREVRVVLLAHPAGHSLSPHMHGAAFAATGIAGSYTAEDVPPAALAAAVGRLRAEPFLGANVTVPHKEAVVPLLDELTPAARAVGAVNTIVRSGARLVGHNTDGAGFLLGLEELAPPGEGYATSGSWLADAHCLVLGAGGAARAVAHALATAGAAVHVLNRDPARAERLVADLGPAVTGGTLATVEPAAVDRLLSRAALLVNTTSVGMQGGPDPHGLPLLGAAQLRLLPATARVVDLVYRPAVTPLLAAAAELGLAQQNGLAMLVWQGALAFQAWTQVQAPVAAMRAAAERGLAEAPHA